MPVVISQSSSFLQGAAAQGSAMQLPSLQYCPAEQETPAQGLMQVSSVGRQVSFAPHCLAGQGLGTHLPWKQNSLLLEHFGVLLEQPASKQRPSAQIEPAGQSISTTQDILTLTLNVWVAHSGGVPPSQTSTINSTSLPASEGVGVQLTLPVLGSIVAPGGPFLRNHL